MTGTRPYPTNGGGRALLGAPGETFRRETFRSAQASLASALGGGSAALGEAPNLAPSARTVHGLDPRGSGPLFFMFIRPQPYTCLGIEWEARRFPLRSSVEPDVSCMFNLQIHVSRMDTACTLYVS